MRKRWAGWLGLLSLAGQASAAQAEACLLRADAETLAISMLPGMIETIHGRCIGRIRSNTALARTGLDQAERYREAAAEVRARSEDIATGLLQANSDIPLPPEMTEEFGLEMFEVGAQQAIAEAMDDDACRTADRVFTALQPLPARNFAALLVMLLELGQRDNADSAAPFRLCTEERR